MNKNYEILVERFLPYVANRKDLDLVSSKFGVLILQNTARDEIEIEVKPIVDFDTLAMLLINELEGDIAEEHNWRDMTPEDAEELRQRFEPYIADLSNADKARKMLNKFIAKQLAIGERHKKDG